MNFQINNGNFKLMTISEENRLVENLDHNVGNTKSRLASAQQRMNKILESNNVDKKTFWIIAGLSLVVVILLVFVLI